MNDKNNKKSSSFMSRKTPAPEVMRQQLEASEMMMGLLQDKSNELDNLVKPGRKAHKPTPNSRTIVQFSAGFGVPHAVIADGLNLSEETLRKHYKAELKKGKFLAAQIMTKTLFSRAMQGDTKAMELYLRTQLKWSNSAEDTLNSHEERSKVLDNELMSLLGVLQQPGEATESEAPEEDESDDLLDMDDE